MDIASTDQYNLTYVIDIGSSVEMTSYTVTAKFHDNLHASSLGDFAVINREKEFYG